MMIFDGVLGCAISVFVLSESVCGRVRQSRTRLRHRQRSGRFAAMMIFDGVLGCATPVSVLSEGGCGRARQSRTRRRTPE
jgi:hypothetical protein